MGGERSAAGTGTRQARRMVRGRSTGLGHLARRALLRLRDPRLSRQVFLCLVRCADWLPRQPEGALRCTRSRHRRIPKGRQRHRTASLHRQGHQLLPHAFLARRAARFRHASAHGGPRPRLPHDRRPEDVEVARHLHHRPTLPRASAARGAALLLRRQTWPRHRRYRPRARRFHRARELGPGRQTGEHRQPLRRFRRQGRRRARERTTGSRAVWGVHGRSTAHRRTVRAPRLRAGHARDHGARRSREPVCGCPQALGARQGPRQGLGGARSRHPRGEPVPGTDALPRPGTAADGLQGRGLPADAFGEMGRDRRTAARHAARPLRAAGPAPGPEARRRIGRSAGRTGKSRRGSRRKNRSEARRSEARRSRTRRSRTRRSAGHHHPR